MIQRVRDRRSPESASVPRRPSWPEPPGEEQRGLRAEATGRGRVARSWSRARSAAQQARAPAARAVRFERRRARRRPRRGSRGSPDSRSSARSAADRGPRASRASPRASKRRSRREPPVSSSRSARLRPGSVGAGPARAEDAELDEHRVVAVDLGVGGRQAASRPRRSSWRRRGSRGPGRPRSASAARPRGGPRARASGSAPSRRPDHVPDRRGGRVGQRRPLDGDQRVDRHRLGGSGSVARVCSRPTGRPRSRPCR